ncbi:RICIN domain-containing protein [Collinsella aerofaciens]|uniref:RICIN domain-containing protein n=1 Tax=Collinsella aerofaciens TaxID=74426 RepID=UPI003983D334
MGSLIYGPPVSCAPPGTVHISVANPGSASQLWRVSALGGGRYSFTSASGLALDDRGQRTSEGNTVWLYEPNGGPAQAWVLT